MQTKDRPTYRQALPDWGFETLQVLADTHRLLAVIEREVRYAERLRGLDPRVGEKLHVLREAAGLVQARLSACEYSTQQVIAEMIETRPA